MNSIYISVMFLRFKGEGDLSSSFALGLVSTGRMSESIIGIRARPS
jgi:hypothetical protein